SKLEYWEVSCTETSTPNLDAKITLFWSPNSMVGHGGDDANALQDLRIAHYMNASGITKWQMDGAGLMGFVRNGNIDYGKISANDFIQIKLSFSNGSLSLKDPSGKLLKTVVVNNNLMQLDMQNFAAGVSYILSEYGDTKVNLKFVIMH